MEKIYEVEGLSFSYPNQEVLDNLNFQVNKKDFVGIIGSNGSGKSTLLKIMVGALKDFTGQVKFLGRDIKKIKRWQDIGYVPQVDRKKEIVFPISVKEMVVLNLYYDFNFFNQPRKKHWDMVDDVLEMMNITELKDKNFNDLSGGQKQKVMIAKALVHGPQVLIFDEPTVGIDDKSKREFFASLDHLNKKHGITIIMVTHELESAKKHFSRKLYLKDGKLREGDHVSI